MITYNQIAYFWPAEQMFSLRATRYSKSPVLISGERLYELTVSKYALGSCELLVTVLVIL